MAEAAAYAARRRGQVAFAVRVGERLYGRRVHHSARTASLLKPMLLVAYLNHPAVRDRPLHASDLRLISPMIRRSDSVAATRVRDYVGDARLRRVARRAGMRRFRTHPMWGHSRTTAADQSRFFLTIDHRVVPRHRRTARALLASVVPAQRWGIGRVSPPGWRLYLKGGWSTGTGEVDHQVALLRRGAERISIAILTEANGSHAYGKETLRGVAVRLLAGLDARAEPARGPPSGAEPR